LRTVLLTQSVMVLTRITDVRIKVIIIYIVNTLRVCVSVRFTDSIWWLGQRASQVSLLRHSIQVQDFYSPVSHDLSGNRQW
jgi:hypothetical protein